MKQASFDVIGNIALVKFQKEVSSKAKKEFAEKLLKRHKSVKTVLEKIGKFKGRLRKQTTKYLAGEKTKETLYRENGCAFRFNIDSSYFSPRLSNERIEIAKKIKKEDEVLVMFAGVAPYSIIIAKKSKASKVYSNEINREANRYAELNIGLNKVKGKVVLLPGDIKRVAKRLSHPPTQKKVTNNGKNIDSTLNAPRYFDTIVMPRPQLKETFLPQAFMLSKKGTRVFYYDFCKQEEIKSILEKIQTEAKKTKKKIKILKVKKAGEVGPYKFRIRVDFIVL